MPDRSSAEKAIRIFAEHNNMLYRERARKPDFRTITQLAELSRVNRIMRPYLEALA